MWGISAVVTLRLFQFLCAQHVSDINISITRSLRLFYWITTLVVLFLVRCVLEFRCGWFGVVSVLQAEACPLSIIRSFSLHTQQGYTSYRSADSLRAGAGRNVLLLHASCMTYTIAVCAVKNSWWGQGNCPKHVDFYSKNKFEKLGTASVV